MDISDYDHNCTHNYVKKLFPCTTLVFFINVYIYVCMCMKVCMYVYMYACMYVRIYVCMNVCMYVCIYVCKYACIVVYVCGNCNWLMFSGVFGMWW